MIGKVVFTDRSRETLRDVVVELDGQHAFVVEVDLAETDRVSDRAENLLSGQAFSSVHWSGCWFWRAKSMTWCTLVSATS